MTRNQRLVLVWLQDHCSNSGVVRVSNQELALNFGWSQQYTQKILSNLVSAGHLEELQKGIGRRATKYRVSFSGNRNRASHNQMGTVDQVHSHNQKRRGYFSNKRTLFDIGFSSNNAQPNTRTRKGDVFKNAVRTLKPVKTSGGPFRRFRGHWDRVQKWGATDFVCYYSFVHRVRFGDEPALNWPIECGSARTLLKRVGGPEELKAFIQVAFGISKRKPNGLRSFVYDYVYDQVINADEDYVVGFQDEYDDEFVFPWVKDKILQKSRIAAQEYQRNLVRIGLGI